VPRDLAVGLWVLDHDRFVTGCRCTVSRTSDPLQLPVQGVIHATTAVSLSFMQKFEVGRPLCYLSWLDEVDLTYFNIFFVEEGPS
jgi:hypothetical protein